MLITEVPAGHTIGMLDGVVRLDSVMVDTDPSKVIALVSIGKLKGHPVRMAADAIVTVYSIDPDIAPWYGV